MSNIYGTSAGDSLVGTSGYDYLDGGLGADTMAGGAGNDVYAVDNAGDQVIENPGEGTDRVNSLIGYALGSSLEDLWLVGVADSWGTGNALDNVMWGNAGRNLMSGGAGNDVLDGGAGADTLDGGAGDDTIWIDDAGDVVVEQAGQGIDTVKSKLDGYVLADNVENLVLLAGAGDLSGSGNALGNRIDGNDGNNAINGGAGDDTLDGGAGNDTLAGGSGSDTYRVDSAGDMVIENTDEGLDTVWSSASSYTLGANVENLHLGRYAFDTQALDGTGNGLDNALYGNSGANHLDGGAGNDTLAGGAGNDTLTGGAGRDSFYLSTDQAGTDTIADLASGESIEVCGTFLHGAVTRGTGVGLAAGHVQARTMNNVTTLYLGLDETPGADMTIVLKGAYAAADFTLRGYTIIYDTNHAPMLSAPIADQHASAGSAFTAQVPAGAFTDRDAGDVVTLSAIGIDPDWGLFDLPSWLSFDAATRTFSGTPAGTDAGSFLIMVTATDSHGASTSDAFELSVAPAPVFGTTGNDTIDGTAFDDTQYGLAGNDALRGFDGSDRLLGGDGNDTLDGGAGSDTLDGGAGNDTYLVDLVGAGAKVVPEDAVLESVNGGIDSLVLRAADGVVTGALALTLTLARELENLDISATGTNRINLVGNASANVLTGNDAANTQSGGGGNDTLDGGAGADVLTGGAGHDVFVFSDLPTGGAFDRITDYSVINDSIRLDHTVFDALGAPGALASAAFWKGATAHDADDRVIYDAASGAVYYDPDGTGAQSQVEIVLIGAGLAMNSAEITVI